MLPGPSHEQTGNTQQPSDMLKLTFLLRGGEGGSVGGRINSSRGGMSSKHHIVWYRVHAARGQDPLSCLKGQQLILMEELLSELRELSCGHRPLVCLRREVRRSQILFPGCFSRLKYRTRQVPYCGVWFSASANFLGCLITNESLIILRCVLKH